jgi:hypothetical protein
MPLVRGCRNRWCPDYAGPDGWCDRHRKPLFGNYPALPPGWPVIRAAQLAAFPLCYECGAPATDVHHVDGRGAGDGPGNLQSLCGRCHRRVTAKEGGHSWA